MNKNNTSDKLLTKLIELGSNKGLDNISLSLLASSLNLSKSTIFSHYKNKADLVDTMYNKGKSLTNHKELHFSFDGDAEEILTRAVDYWHEVYSSISEFNRIVEMQKYVDSRAKDISLSFESMIKSQSQIVIEVLSETEKLEIDDLDLAIESFSTTVTKYLKRELLDSREDTQWKEDRFILRFCKHYKKDKASN